MNSIQEANYKNLLCNLLDCGEYDLSVLKDVEYEWCDIISDLKISGIEVNLNSIMARAFEYGLGEIKESIENRINELKIWHERTDEEFEAECEELELLKYLDPYEDMEGYYNFLDTHMYITDPDKREIYEKYLSKELNHFKEMTGYAIE